MPKKTSRRRRSASTKLPPPPFPLSMVVCDYIHKDPGTGKPFLMGCFSVIQVLDLPATHPAMGLYVELTNGRGKVPFTTRLVDANEEYDPIWELSGEIDFPDPRMIMQIVLTMRNVTFARAGEYRIQIHASNEFLMERRILVMQGVAEEETPEFNQDK